MATAWRVRLFGEVGVEGPGIEGPTEFETVRAAKLLALLALVRSGTRREDLADALWPDDYFDATRLRLRKELSRLRRALGPAAEALLAETDGVGLDRGRIDTDLDLLRRADANPSPVRLREAAEASAGEFLPRWDDPWALAERTAADALKRRVLAAHGEALLADGRPEDALTAAREAVRTDPGFEPARLVAMRAHAALGSLASAVGEFQAMKRALRGHDRVPSVEAEALLESVQRGESEAPLARLPQLLAPFDRFHGRGRELADLVEALAPQGAVRLTTVIGTGGIGKSRLAQEAALVLRDIYDGSVAFVSLAETPSPEAAAATLLAHLGWRGDAKTDPAKVVASSLPPGPCLLVLDGLEHLLPGAADLAKRLLETCPSLRILATSRTPLRLAGERTFSLGPLGDDAPAMLRDLARAVRPGLDEDPLLTELAMRLDGIPLALRLAAARLRVLPPQALLDRLGERFRLLQGDAPDLPIRHRSLRAALDGSFEHLEPRERRVLAAMAPFRGGWTLAHLERVLPDEDGLASMEALVDASLVGTDDRAPSVRFEMLETVREYVAARVGSPEAETAFARAMAEFLWAAFPDATTPRRLATMAECDVEADNLHAAVETAIRVAPETAERLLARLWIYDATRGRHRDFDRLVREFERTHPNAEPLASVAFGNGVVKHGMAEVEGAVENFRIAEGLCATHGDHENAALIAAVILASERRLRRRSLEDTLALFPRLVEQAKSLAARERIALLEVELLLFYARRLEDAAARADEARELAECLGDEVGFILATQLRALAAFELRAYSDAARLVESANNPVARLGDPSRSGFQHELRGRVALAQGRASEALAAFDRSREVWAGLGNAYQVADQDNSRARALVSLDRPAEALDAAWTALRGWRSCDDLGGVAVALHTAAAAHLLAGNRLRASEALAQARGLTHAHGLEFVLSEHDFVAALGPLEPAEPHRECLAGGGWWRTG